MEKTLLIVAFLPLLPFLLWELAGAASSPRVRFEPTPVTVVRAMTDLAAVRASDRVYDLGCGDGRVVIAAAKLGASAVCVDIDPERIAEARQNAEAAGVSQRIEFRNQDLFDVELTDATVVMLFLSPDYNLALKPRLRRLSSGTRIVSHWHGMGDWQPEKKVEVPVGGRNHPVFLWVVP